MKLKSLHIDRMPGFARGGVGLKEVCPGINLIYGPNGSGKTTVCRAIKALIWPESFPKGEAIALRSLWEEGDRLIQLDREGSAIDTDGVCRFPPVYLSGCSVLTLDDLFASSDRDLAQLIWKEVSGGYDLAKVRESEKFALGRFFARTEWKEVLDAKRALFQVSQRHKDLYEKRERLKDLEKEIAKAKEAKEQLHMIAQRVQIEEEEKLCREELAQIGDDEVPNIDLQVEITLLREKEEQKKRAERELIKEQKRIEQQLYFIGPTDLQSFTTQGADSLRKVWKKWEKACINEEEIFAKESFLEVGEKELSAKNSCWQWLLVEKEKVWERSAFFACILSSFWTVASLITAWIGERFHLFFAPLALLGAVILWQMKSRSIRKRQNALEKKIASIISLPSFNFDEVYSFYLKTSANEQTIDELSQRKLRLQKEKEKLEEEFYQMQKNFGLQELALGRDVELLLTIYEKIYEAQMRINDLKTELEECTKEYREVLKKINEVFSANHCAEAEAEWNRLQLRIEEGKRAHKVKARLEVLEKKKESLIVEKEEWELSLQAAKYEELIQEYAAVEKEVDITCSSQEMSRAKEKLLKAQKEYEKKVNDARYAHLGHFILERIEKAYAEKNQSKVLKKAQEWFAQFCHGKYAILPPQEGEFRLLDTVEQEVKRLDQLSRGTRIQLLLAIRLSFAVINEEHYTSLPLIFDEALTHADPERFRAIASALAMVAERGKQIFYFCCRPEELSMWKEAVGDNTYNVITLKKEHIVLPEVERKMVAAPEGRELSAYLKELDVPPIQPELGVSAIHLGHLVATSEQLYRLCSAHIETYGQLCALKEAKEIFLSPKEMEKVEAKAKVLDLFCKLWKKGRGKALHREAIENAGFGKKFIAPLFELAREGGYSARAFLKALETKKDERVKGIRQNTIVRAKEMFLQEGYLVEQEPLTEEEMRTELLQCAHKFNIKLEDIKIFSIM